MTGSFSVMTGCLSVTIVIPAAMTVSQNTAFFYFMLPPLGDLTGA
jgi:hypothetical protein